MLSVLKAKNPYEQPAMRVYGTILKYIRQPHFYTDYGVPDTFDGRFDLMLLHVFLVVRQTLIVGGESAEHFNQALFDATFSDMDQTLREMGIGDMGIPKHMRRMMKAFNGRMHTYDEAMKEGALQNALKNNLYGTVEQVDESTLIKMEEYALNVADTLKQKGCEAILNGELEFKSDE